MNLRILVHVTALLLANLLAAEITVQTRFSQSQISLGNPVQYIVEISATSTDSRPSLSAISSLPISDTGGLKLRNGRTSNNSNASITNGRAEYRVTQSAIIDVIAPSTGSFTIPSFQMVIDGQAYTAPAATLVVVENTEGELVFIETSIPDEIYLGQTTEVEIQLFIANGVRSARIRSYEFSADGFSAPTQLPDNERETTELVDGRSYQVITWPLEITPLTAGKQDIEIQFMLSAQIPNRGDPSSSARSPFGRSMFDDFFARTENFPVYFSNSVDILPLPSSGKPASYSGAVGDFGMEVSTDLQECEVGEPIMLSLKLTGRGNFGRIQGPELPSDSTWKIYNPEGQMEHDPTTGKPVSKRFDYVMIPKKPGILETPEIRFSFFDPVSKEYSELEGPPLTIKVSPSSNRFAPLPEDLRNTQHPATDIPEPNFSKSLTREEALMTLDYQPRSGRTPDAGKLFTSTGFILLNSMLLLATVASAVYLRKQSRLRDDPEYAAMRQIAADLKRATAEALRAESADEFYHHALETLRLTISHKAQKNLRSAELPQLLEHLKKWNTSTAVNDAATKLFTDAYQIRFSGSPDAADLSHARTQLKLVIKAL